MTLDVESVVSVLNGVKLSYPRVTVEYSVLSEAILEYANRTTGVIGSGFILDVLKNIRKCYLDSSNEAIALEILIKIYDEKRQIECERDAMYARMSHHC